MKCPGCGALNNDNNRFCHNCGQTLPAAAVFDRQQPAEQPQQPGPSSGAQQPNRPPGQTGPVPGRPPVYPPQGVGGPPLNQPAPFPPDTFAARPQPPAAPYPCGQTPAGTAPAAASPQTRSKKKILIPLAAAFVLLLAGGVLLALKLLGLGPFGGHRVEPKVIGGQSAKEDASGRKEWLNEDAPDFREQAPAGFNGLWEGHFMIELFPEEAGSSSLLAAWAAADEPPAVTLRLAEGKGELKFSQALIPAEAWYDGKGAALDAEISEDEFLSLYLELSEIDDGEEGSIRLLNGKGRFEYQGESFTCRAQFKQKDDTAPVLKGQLRIDYPAVTPVPSSHEGEASGLETGETQAANESEKPAGSAASEQTEEPAAVSSAAAATDASESSAAQAALPIEAGRTGDQKGAIPVMGRWIGDPLLLPDSGRTNIYTFNEDGSMRVEVWERADETVPAANLAAAEPEGWTLLDSTEGSYHYAADYSRCDLHFSAKENPCSCYPMGDNYLRIQMEEGAGQSILLRRFGLDPAAHYLMSPLTWEEIFELMDPYPVSEKTGAHVAAKHSKMIEYKVLSVHPDNDKASYVDDYYQGLSLDVSFEPVPEEEKKDERNLRVRLRSGEGDKPYTFIVDGFYDETNGVFISDGNFRMPGEFVPDSFTGEKKFTGHVRLELFMLRHPEMQTAAYGGSYNAEIAGLFYIFSVNEYTSEKGTKSEGTDAFYIKHIIDVKGIIE